MCCENWVDVDELIEKINNSNDNITICRYALENDILVAIINNDDNSLDKLPFRIIYDKDNFLIIHTDKDLDKNVTESSIYRNYKRIKQMLIIAECINNTQLNKNNKIGSFDNCYSDLDDHFNCITYFEWSLSKENIKKKKRQLIK